MNTFPNNNSLTNLDYDLLSPSAINLSSENITAAVELSDKIPHITQKWQTYINSLALFAFREWLESRADMLKINQNQCTLLQPALANFIPVIANLQVEKFKICIIPTGVFDDFTVTIPQIVVDIPEYIPHFYVLVQVLEEQASAIISGFLSYEELKKNLVQTNLPREKDWNYELPVSWFDAEPNNLLLYLRCLTVEAINLPAIPQNRPQMLASMEAELTALLPQLQSSQRQLWEILTWEQATAVFTHPQLLQSIYHSQQQSQESGSKTNFKDLLKLYTEPALNVGRWLWDELDELAQEFSWNLLPYLTPANMRKTPTEEFQIIINHLKNQGVEIPAEARGAYQDLLLAGIPLRLYAMTWNLLSETDSNLWSLLLILGTTSHHSLAKNLKLRVSDQTSILLEKGINQEHGDAYVFTRLVGTWDEKFLVSISLMDGVEINLPPFTFNLRS